MTTRLENGMKKLAKNMSADQRQREFEKVGRLHEAERQRIIVEEGDINPYKTYEVLDRLATIMFYLMTGGEDTLTLSNEWIEAHAEKVAI